MESEQATPMDWIKDVAQSSMYTPKFNKHLKKARGHIGQNVVNITKIKTLVWKPWMIDENTWNYTSQLAGAVEYTDCISSEG